MTSEPIHVAGTDGALTYRYKPALPGTRLSIVLLHGLTGDERVMWALESALPPGSLMVAPRGPFAAQLGGYSWRRSEDPLWPAMEDLREGAVALSKLVASLPKSRGLEPERLALVGFSQGAALAFAAASLQIVQPAAIVALAGFLPDGNTSALERLPVFWGHGILDELVPIARAREGAERLHAAGVRLTFCESEVGHKLGADCLRGLRVWFRETFPGLSES